MNPIQMVDLKRQYHKLKTEIDSALINVLESTAFINGKPVQDFANNLSAYLGVKHVIPCANGTDAVQIALMALGLEPGDEVITPSFTFIATTEVIALLRLTPVFVDVDPKTFCLDPRLVEKAVTTRTKAIVPVHLYGQTAPMNEIMQIARKHNLYVIEDNAQSIGSDYLFPDGTKKKSGTIGTIGTTSFFPAKNLGAYGDGGAIFTNDDELANKIKMIANHGQSKQYYHDIVGCNSRLDTMQAAILNIKLSHLDEYIRERKRVADFYDKAFSFESLGAESKGITTPFRASYSDHVFHQYTILVEPGEDNSVSRDALKDYLAKNNIPSMIYYPVPSHRQKMFAGLEHSSVNLPVSEWLGKRVLSLPIHTEMTQEQLEFITSKILEFHLKPQTI